MAKLEDLKGRRIINVRVMPDSPPEECGQLELTLDDGKTVTIMRQPYQDIPETHGDTIVKIDGETVYSIGNTFYVIK